jgi:hypothetical protein
VDTIVIRRVVVQVIDDDMDDDDGFIRIEFENGDTVVVVVILGRDD